MHNQHRLHRGQTISEFYPIPLLPLTEVPQLLSNRRKRMRSEIPHHHPQISAVTSQCRIAFGSHILTTKDTPEKKIYLKHCRLISWLYEARKKKKTNSGTSHQTSTWQQYGPLSRAQKPNRLCTYLVSPPWCEADRTDEVILQVIWLQPEVSNPEEKILGP